ncbi:DUF3592 domain-containing protein [Hymenobacter canadensis]|uniref:DUF3592 domain-containing protein n=1 Tax=Hymenobacter canadensis TaxID=2999067 RepID=A0ABY7LQY2_9BACT|nr:DUF3592 domain-containing protein [Hymenobacter canadensis]WBA42823.1 hypothetical protein O3303_04500 [Hymenobacter canadensis]
MHWLVIILLMVLLSRMWLRSFNEALASLKRAIRLKRYGVHKTGEIIGFVERVDEEGDRWFRPIIAFSYQGKQWQFVSELGDGENGLVGAYVRVIHDPLTPGVAEVDSFMALFGGPVLGLVILATCVVLAVGYVIHELLAQVG